VNPPEFAPTDGKPLLLGIIDARAEGLPSAMVMARSLAVIRPGAGSEHTPAEILRAANRALYPAAPNHLCVILFHRGLDILPGREAWATPPHGAAVPPSSAGWQADGIIALNLGRLAESTGFDEPWTALLRTHPPLNPAQALRDLRQFLGESEGGDGAEHDPTFLVVQHQPRHPLPPEDAAWEWHIAMGGDLDRPAPARRRLASILAGAGLGAELIHDAQLVVEELLANTIRYGATAASPCRINMHFHLTATHLEMRFEDTAPPFNPLAQIAPPDLDADDEARALGGFGFHLVRKLAERIDYAYRDGRNVLMVALALPAARPG
jgi:sigma-B regulation protein RsbU (phosphoserine phosphatase)